MKVQGLMIFWSKKIMNKIIMNKIMIVIFAALHAEKWWKCMDKVDFFFFSLRLNGMTKTKNFTKCKDQYQTKVSA